MGCICEACSTHALNSGLCRAVLAYVACTFGWARWSFISSSTHCRLWHSLVAGHAGHSKFSSPLCRPYLLTTLQTVCLLEVALGMTFDESWKKESCYFKRGGCQSALPAQVVHELAQKACALNGCPVQAIWQLRERGWEGGREGRREKGREMCACPGSLLRESRRAWTA